MVIQKTHVFDSKVKIFQEICSKLYSPGGNLPSSGDLVGILKYFQTSLHGFSRDIQDLNLERFESRSNDNEWRLQYISQLNYSDLYVCLLNAAEHIQKMTNQTTICEHILRTLHNLIIFLDYDTLEGVPLALAWMLLYFPNNVHPSVIELMCTVVFPLVYIGKDEQESFALDSIPSILMLVFQHVEKIEYHVWVFENLMSKKREIHKDLLTIIAYGPTEARLPAVCMLFHYWPELVPPMFHQNQTLVPLHYAWEPWKPLTCERTDCPNKSGKALAMKMTVNPRISAQHAGKPPPFYVCLDCADALNRKDFDQLIDILLPSKQVSLLCESKTCRSKNKQASFTCWSAGCTYLNGNRAIRFCEACHTLRHSYGQASATTLDVAEPSSSFIITGERNKHPGRHIYQMALQDVWDMPLDLQYNMVEAIVALTGETMPRWRQLSLNIDEFPEDPVNRSVLGLTCTGSNPPGAPAAAGDLMMMGVNTSATPSSLGVVPTPTPGTSGLGTNLGLPQGPAFPEFPQAQPPHATTRGIAGISSSTANATYEVGELPLAGRYSDEDHKLLAVYGALLAGEKCRPRQECLNVELLTRITAGIFNWFVETIYTAAANSAFEDRGTLRHRYELGDLLERVKGEYILKWIQEIQRLHPAAVYAVLLPHPLEYARVGACWESLCDRTTQVKHGLSRIGSLIPYDIVTFETWDFVVPYWMEAIRTEVPRTDYPELEILLKKIFDATAGPFPFVPQKVYHFVNERFINTPVGVQDQALAWLEILTCVDVPIPMKELLTMFRQGVESFQTEMLMPRDQDYHRTSESDEDTRDRSSSSAARSRHMASRPQTPFTDISERSDSLFPNEENFDGDHQPTEVPGTSSGKPDSRMSRSISLGKNILAPSVDTSKPRHRSQPARKFGKEKRKRKRKSTTGPREYRMSECLSHMLSLASRQLKIHDPIGHSGYAQETPQLLLKLLGDMLQLYWGHPEERLQSGLKDTCCIGLETCIFSDKKSSAVGEMRECLHCLDMLAWLNYAALICQHLAPSRQAPKVVVEFSVDALIEAAEFPEYRDWRHKPSHLESPEHLIQASDSPPSPAELNQMPSVIRVVYLLVRFLRNHVDVTTESSEQTTSPNEAERSTVDYESTKDPIALQCVLECLVYLCHVGDCLQQIISRSEKSAAKPGDAAHQIGEAGIKTTTASKTTGLSVSTGYQSTSSTGAQLQVQFVYYLVHCHLIPSLWGLLRSEISHLACWIVPLLFHCLTLPGGSNVFWRILVDEFGHSDWRIRFNAIEKVAVLLRELDQQVLSRGFSGAAGTKILNALSGGSMASASGVNLFGRNAASATPRTRSGGGRIMGGKSGPSFGRAHGSTATGADIKPTGPMTNVNENPLIRTAVAHAFCCLIGSLDDRNSVIAQFASMQLASLNNTALACAIQCLEFQFDVVIADRCIILQRMHQLSCCLPDRQVFTWEFFVKRFGLLALQAQMQASGQTEIDAVTDLNGYHRSSQQFQNQFERACFAMARCHGLRTISNSHAAHGGPSNSTTAQFTSTNSGRRFTGRTPAMPASSSPSVSEPERQQSPQFAGARRSRMSVTSITGLFPGNIAGGEFMESANKLLNNIRTALDQDDQARDTLHQWVRLLLKFMATVHLDHRSDRDSEDGPLGTGNRRTQSSSSKDELRDWKALSKAQRHLAFLLGYCDGTFTLPPYRMRNSTVFHAFLAHVGSVLDFNYGMGTCILHQTLVTLQYCASPQRYAADSQPPTFTLRLLEPHLRWHWLKTLLVILYKYEYGGTASSWSNSGPTAGAHTTGTNTATTGSSGMTVGGVLRSSRSDPNLIGIDDMQKPGSTTMGATASVLGATGANVAGRTRAMIEYLIQIVLNTMDSQIHVCRERTDDEPFDTPSPHVRLREVSNVSTDFTTIVETDTPPASPVQKTMFAEDDEIVMPGVTVTTCDPKDVSFDGSVDVKNGFDNNEQDKQPEPPVTSGNDTKLVTSSTLTDVSRELLTQPPINRVSSDQFFRLERGHNLGEVGPASPGSTETILTSGPATVSQDERAMTTPIVSESADTSGLKGGSQIELQKIPERSRSDAPTELKILKKSVPYGYRKLIKSSHQDSTPKHSRSTVVFTTESIEDGGKYKSPGRKYHYATRAAPGDSAFEYSTTHPVDGPQESISPDTTTPSKYEKKSSTSGKKSHSLYTQSTLPRSGSASNLTMASAAATAILTTERCPWCNQILEHYDESTLGLGLVCLATFVHREPSIAAPFLKDILLTTSRLATASFYSWQADQPNVIVPGNVASIARQILRCTLYNLAPNGLFVQLFQTVIPDDQFFKCIITVLVDFEEHLSIFQPLIFLLDALNKRKNLPTDTLPVLLENLANYLEHLPVMTDDSKVNHFIASGWSELIPPLELFFRKVATITPVPHNLAVTLRTMTYTLRSPVAPNFKTLPETFSAILRLIVEHVPFSLTSVIELCSLSNRTLKERTKVQLSKTLVELFWQAIKFRISLPDENLVKLLQFILMDAGGTMEPNQVVEGLTAMFNPQTYHLFSTGAAELMKQHLPDCIAFISDVHTMHKVKQAQKLAVRLNMTSISQTGATGVSSAGGNGISRANTAVTSSNLSSTGGLISSGAGVFSSNSAGVNGHGGASLSASVSRNTGGVSVSSIPSLHEDVLGAHLKAGLAQYVSLELSRSNSNSDQDVLPMLAPGLLTDIRPAKSTGFTIQNTPNHRLKPPVIHTNPLGSASSGMNSDTGSQILSPVFARNSRSSGSSSSRQSVDGTSVERTSIRGNENTIIVITPSTDSNPPDSTSTEVRASLVSELKTGVGTSRTPSPIPSIASSSISGTETVSGPTAGGSTPGAPSVNVSRLGPHSHVTLTPTFSQTSQSDAPVLHLFPWLKSIPPATQMGPRDFLIMVERVRTLSWILLGATMNMALTREATGLTCRPIPFTLVRAVADLVKALLSSFPEQQKQSVTVMSSLYHAFLLCQLWTVYCETAASFSPPHSTQHKAAMATAVDFWTRITPTVLRLLSISEDFVIVSGRLLSVIEELIECQCSVVTRLFPIWIPMLCGRPRQLPGNMMKRLHKCAEWEPPDPITRLILLFELPEEADKNADEQKQKRKHADSKYPAQLMSTSKHSLPGLTPESLLNCQANSLMGCFTNLSKGWPEESFSYARIPQCCGHALASSAPFSNEGVGTGVGMGAGAMGNDMLTSRLVAWLKKHIFVLGRNEDQHSTASHIFVH